MTEGKRPSSRPRPLEFDPEAARPLPVPVEETAALEPVLGAAPPGGGRKRGWLKLTLGALAALVAVALGFDTAELFARAWSVSPWLGGFVASMVLAAVFGLLGLAAGELAALRRLARIDALRADAVVGGDKWVERVAALYAGRADMEPALAELRRQMTDAHDDEELRRLVDRIVLRDLDRRAYALVLRAARDTAVVTALSPAALLDAAMVVWRNLRLVRQVAALYGARPGWLGSLRLLRRMVANLAVAGVAESGSDLTVEALGGTLAAALSARVGQGIVNGLLTARIGITAMHLCRPLAFGPDERPSLRRIRQELMTVPKQVL